ncbi:unnamed protein product, partial [Medioppia subpectinata]
MIRIFARKETPEQRQAWREKVTLCMLISLACFFLAGITFFMNIFICNTSTILIFNKLKPENFEDNIIVANGKLYGTNKEYPLENSTHLFRKRSEACKRAFGHQISSGTFSESNFEEMDKVYFDWSYIQDNGFIVIDNKVYDPSYCDEEDLSQFIQDFKGSAASKTHLEKYDKDCIECFKDSFYSGEVSFKSNGCILGDIVLWMGTVIIFGLILTRFFLALFYAWHEKKRAVSIRGNTPVILQVACYSEGAAGWYEHNGKKSRIMVVNKVGNPGEVVKAGNRGKRDSQVILMSFFSKILYSDRMSDLDCEIYRKMKRMFNKFSPEDFEILLMVDADTIVEPDAVVKMVSAFEKDNKIMGLCGETQISNKCESWVTALQVFEYYISHHLAKNFESVFGGVTCLPGCFCIYRIKIVTDQHGNIKNHSDKKIYDETWTCVPILANPIVVNPYSVFEAKTLHEQNLLHLGEDRYLTTLLMKNFYKRKLIFLAAAKCSTCVPNDYKTLQSQRRRWINSTIHNMFELVLVDKLCGTGCFSMQFIIFFELFGTLTLPAAIFFTGVLLVKAFIGEPAWIPLVMLALILGLPAVLIALTTFQLQYFGWLLIYIINLPIWNFFLPVYAFWHFDDFSWGDTRKTESDSSKKDEKGEFDATSITFVELEELKNDILKEFEAKTK